MQILNKLNDRDNSQQYSLKQNVFYRFQEIFNDVRQKYQNIGTFILVVDQQSLKVISSALKMADLIKMGVSSIEKLELKRKEHPDIHAIYYITPTQESVSLLISDFEGSKLQIENTNQLKKGKEEKQKEKEKDKKKKKKKGKKGEEEKEDEDEQDDEIIEENEESKKKKKIEKLNPLKKDAKNQTLLDEVQYGRVHIFFTQNLPKLLLQDIAKSEKLVKRIRTMKEFNHNFFFFEQNGFQLNLDQSLPILFSRKESRESKQLFEQIADRLITVLPALLRFNVINILYNSLDNSSPSNQFAQYFEKRVQEAVLKLKQGNSPYIDSQAGDVYMIIIDRSIDPVTPLIHDNSYQSMIYDLLEVDTEKNIVEYEKTELKKDGVKDTEPIKEVKTYKQQLSDQKDEVYAKFRYKNITQAINGIREDFERNTEKIQQAKSENKIRDIEDVNKIINEFPEYKELLQKYAVHFDLIMKCFTMFKKWNLQLNCELEQSLVTGVDDVGKAIKSDKIFASIQEILSRKDIKRVDRIRIALIAFITLDLAKEQRDLIFIQFEVSEQKLLKNLTWLGITFSDDKNAVFSRVNQKIVDVSKEKYNAYLNQKKNCSECKKLKGEIKKSKKGEEEQSCDACGQEYFIFSVMRHTPLSVLALNSAIKQIASQSYDQSSDFSAFGFGVKTVGSSGARQKSPNKIIQTQPDESIGSQSKLIKNKKDKSSSKKKDKEEMELQAPGDLHKKNELESLLKKSDNEDIEALKKSKKVVVFYLGGISYAEIRSLRQFQENNYENTPIIIGGTHLLTHRNYLEGLEQMASFS